MRRVTVYIISACLIASYILAVIGSCVIAKQGDAMLKMSIEKEKQKTFLGWDGEARIFFDESKRKLEYKY